MHELTLSKHFTKRWLQRVGNWPTAEAVRHFLQHSVRVQPCQDLVRKDGRPYRVLAIYWHPELDLVIKVDTTNWTAVTVLSRENWQGDEEQQIFMLPCAQQSKSIGERIARIRSLFGAKSRCA
jgi:hypothetical protein